MNSAIVTERMELRELSVADYSEEYLSWLRDPQVHQFLETRHQEQSAQSIRDFVASVKDRIDEFLFGMFLRGDNRHIGNAKIGPIRQPHRLADISLFIGARDCWGQGYASEAIDALSVHAFRTLGIAKLSASMYASNVGSRRAFLRAGFRHEGLRRDHYDLAGERCDIIELGLLPGDCEALFQQ